jgi:signal transduction histidine kinase
VTAVQDAAYRAASRAALTVSVSAAGSTRPVPSSVCNAAVSIVHEAITNVVKHAGARRVNVSVTFRRRGVRVAVRDDGRGLAVPREGGGTAHIGLAGMRERASEIGAAIRVSSAPGRGMLVRLDIPLGR